VTRNSTEAGCPRLVARYKELRKITRELHNEVLPKYLSKRTFEVCGKKLGVLRNNTFVLDNMDQTGVIMDYCIYDYEECGLNAVSRYIADSELDPGSDEYAVVRAMSESFHTLVQVEDVLPGVGVRANDLMADRQYLLIDMGLSHTAVRGVVIAVRLLPFADFVMTTGAPLPVDREGLVRIFDFAVRQYGNEDGRYISLDMREKADLTAAIIRICLETQSSHEIEYQDGELEPVTSPLHRETRIRRNEPCPCGSGRKYKRCCGSQAE